MPVPKRWIPILSFLTVGFIFWIAKPSRPVATWDLPVLPAELHTPMGMGMTDEASNIDDAIGPKEEHLHPSSDLGAIANVSFQLGTVKAVGEPYTKAIVVPKTMLEDVSWIDANFGGDENIRKAIYVVDDPTAELHPPQNKGHEVMVYLSYIIDHYDNLSDVNIFMHSHQYAWHNDDLLDNDAVQMIARLSAERVQREGYMNMRCHWDPGCPQWMRPGVVEEDVNKQEESMLAKTWTEVFPLDSIPDILAQPCCAQFAISRGTILSQPVARYVFYRDWLLRTNLSDYISGRIWEYLWQFIFTGNNVVCPKEHVCYCDGFGVCLGGEDEYVDYYARRKEREALESDLSGWHERNELFLSGEEPIGPQIGKDLELDGKIRGLLAWEKQTKQQAKENGDIAMNRAKEAGRDWKDGDGF